MPRTPIAMEEKMHPADKPGIGEIAYFGPGLSP